MSPIPLEDLKKKKNADILCFFQPTPKTIRIPRTPSTIYHHTITAPSKNIQQSQVKKTIKINLTKSISPTINTVTTVPNNKIQSHNTSTVLPSDNNLQHLSPPMNKNPMKNLFNIKFLKIIIPIVHLLTVDPQFLQQITNQYPERTNNQSN